MTLPGILPFSDDQSEKVVTIQFYRDPKLGGLDEHQARDQLGIEEESSEDEEDEDAEELKKQKAQVFIVALDSSVSHITCFARKSWTL